MYNCPLKELRPSGCPQSTALPWQILATISQVWRAKIVIFINLKHKIIKNLCVDYKDVDPTFGTMEDFETMADEAKKRNLRYV
jgi:hypothetical protein